MSTPAHLRHDPAAERLHRAWQAPAGWRRVSAVNNSIVGRWYTAAAIVLSIREPGTRHTSLGDYSALLLTSVTGMVAMVAPMSAVVVSRADRV